MYVQIFAKSDEDEASRGKTSWFNAGDSLPALQLVSTKATHLGSPPWYVQVKASAWRELSSGERGGEMRSGNYALEVEFTPSDLAALVNFALTNRLVEVVVAEQPSK